MGNKITTPLASAADAAHLASPKKPNGTGPMTVDAAVDKPKRSARPEAGKPTPGSGLGPVRSFTQNDIALRAYLIAEKRRTQGLPGDQHQDWLEAERQIIGETQTTAGSKSRRTKR